MPSYDGVVTLDEADVEVILGLDEDRIRLSAGGTEIGDWSAEECSIADSGEGVFTITAENESLQFTPASPSDFAAEIKRGQVESPASGVVDEEPPHEEEPSSGEHDFEDAKPMTMALFYALAGVTAILGLWALATLVF